MTLKIDCPRPMPEWLSQLTPELLETTEFPLEDILDHSLYYPAAGIDGRPVQFLAGFVHSFIYVDYGREAQDIEDAIQNAGFLDYHRAGSRRLAESELTPKGWRPNVPPEYWGEIERFKDVNDLGFLVAPFAQWHIFVRDKDRDESHGPRRFSLVHLSADGVAAYQALYRQFDKAPEMLAIIRPGSGVNYTHFTDPNGFFAWIVLREDAQHVPTYLVCEGPRACWPDTYPEHVEWFQRENGIGVWRR